jgi:hypothetical protein
MKTPFLPCFVAAGALLAAGCGGGGTPADNSAATLDNAASQSTPESAAVLNTAAQEIRDRNISDPNAVQSAMQAAGNAQAAAARHTGQLGAKPHRPGDPVPPPKLAPGQAMPGNSGAQDQGPR